MSEFIFRTAEPVVIACFDTAKAQAFAATHTELLSSVVPCKEYSVGDAQAQLRDFDIQFTGVLNATDIKCFLQTAYPYVEHTPMLYQHNALIVSRWHQDVNPSGKIEPVGIQFGSSSHSIEVLCGAVKFAKYINRSAVNDRGYLGTKQAEEDIEAAMQSGDAWIYEFPDGCGEGVIIECPDKNIHRRSSAKPKHDFRYVVRAAAFY